jgi:hypothetical protein
MRTYASGFLTAALGTVPSYVRGAWVWKIAASGPVTPAAAGGALTRCQATPAGSAGRDHPLALATGVLGGAPTG